MNSGFFERYNVKIVPFPILDGDGNYKFANSKLITSYVLATDQQGAPAEKEANNESPALNIYRHIFLDKEKYDHNRAGYSCKVVEHIRRHSQSGKIFEFRKEKYQLAERTYHSRHIDDILNVSLKICLSVHVSHSSRIKIRHRYYHYHF